MNSLNKNNIKGLIVASAFSVLISLYIPAPKDYTLALILVIAAAYGITSNGGQL